MKDQCLHCVLEAATAKWLQHNARATTEDLVEMVGRFLGELLSSRREFLGLEGVFIMGVMPGEVDPRKLN